MFGLFAPKCPLDTGEKMWTEFRMQWLAEKLGLDRMLSAEVILTDSRHFPEPYRGTDDDTKRIFDRVCGIMCLDPGRFDLEILADELMPEAGGLYQEGERPRISIARSQLVDFERLVATLAHELAHDILLGSGLITTSVEDHEYLTDLLPVFLGLGVFAANATIRDFHYLEQNRQFYKVTRHGYLPSRMLGYGLALFAYVRGEEKPPWARHLRLDALDPLRKGLRFLNKTGDSLFRPDNARQPSPPPTDAELLESIVHRSPTFRMKALLDVGQREVPPPALMDAVIDRLRDPDDDVLSDAARIVTLYGEAAKLAVPELIAGLGSRSYEVRLYSAMALPMVGAKAELVVPELTRLLDDRNDGVANAAVAGLHRYASDAASAIPGLLESLRIKEVDCLDSEALADAIVAVDPPDDVIERLLHSVEPEICERMMRALRAARYRVWERNLPSPPVSIKASSGDGISE